MNHKDRIVLVALNKELTRRGFIGRFEAHRFYPATRTLVLNMGNRRLLRVWPETRKLDIFTEREQGDGWGSSEKIGEYRGRGWLRRLADDAANTVRKERSAC